MPSLVKVDHPEQFPVATATERSAAPELNVTGHGRPRRIARHSGDFARLRPHPRDSCAVGRHGNQRPAHVESAEPGHLAGVFRAPPGPADETLTKAQLARAKLLFDKGAIAQKDLEVAQDAEAKAAVAVETAVDHLKVLGADPNHPSAIIDVAAPASGVITDQQVTNAAGTQGLGLAESFHHLRPVHGLDYLRRVRERYAVRAHRRVCRYPSQRISEAGP